MVSAEQIEAAGMPSSQVLLGIASNFGAAMKGPGHAEHKSMNLICLGHLDSTTQQGGSGISPELEQ
eukprot:6129730-Heterocapsa_arctica.AAC.1